MKNKLIKFTFLLTLFFSIQVSANPINKINFVGLNFNSESTLLKILPFKIGQDFSSSVSAAEVQGHGPGQETLQLNKQNVEIEKLSPMGSYAISIHFSDGHSTGIYSWSYLHHLCINKDELWLDYSNRVTNSSKNNYHKVEI